MKPDQQRVCDVVMETVIKLCASGLEGSTARVQGVIGVTVDENDVFVIHINDMVQNLSAGTMAAPSSNCHNSQDMSPLPVSPAAVSSASPAPCSSARKRARHRLVFESPNVSRRNDFTEGYGGVRPACGEASCGKVVGSVSQLEPVNQTDYASNDLKSMDVSRRRSNDITEGYGRLRLACGEASHSKVVGSLSQLELVNQTHFSSDLTRSTGAVHAQAPAAKSSVVVVDSDDDDIKLVADQHTSVLLSKHASLCGAESVINVVEGLNFVNPACRADAVCAADAVSNLCIADVIGSVTGWSMEQDDASLPPATETLPTVIKDDLNYVQDDDDDVVTVMEDSECETTQLYATATPPRQFQVILE